MSLALQLEGGRWEAGRGGEPTWKCMGDSEGLPHAVMKREGHLK